MTRPTFEEFPKIPRLRRTIIISEKIDGTNGQVHITKDGEVYAGSRTRWVTPEADNQGFACWVEKYRDGLKELLGPGTHYGEWFGAGIQRRYGLLDKKFYLFNTHRWKHFLPTDESYQDTQAKAPGIGVVPTLYIGEYSDSAIQSTIEELQSKGSSAVPGFMNPEGVVVYMTASGTMHKILLENDELSKGLVPYTEKKLQEVSVL